jgi:hypothetical protein
MMHWKGFGRKRSLPNFKVLSRHLSGELRRTTKTLSQNSLSSGRDLNPGSPENTKHEC